MLHLTHFSLVLGSVVIYKIYWEACAELLTTCVGLLGISAVVFGVEDLSFQAVLYCRDPVCQEPTLIRVKLVCGCVASPNRFRDIKDVIV